MVAEIHARMPLIIAPGDYARWLREEPDAPRPDAAISGRAHAHVPISTRVNKPETTIHQPSSESMPASHRK
jgi:putative SOS response-associated peptidase YedK